MVAPAQPLSTNTPERIRELTTELQCRIGGCGGEIADINLQTRLLSMNAQIEAARAGQAGRAFSIVGREMVSLSQRTAQAAKDLQERTGELMRELTAISRRLATDVRGTRLADLAMTNIDLIDRNLYERSCDCRWWATDGAVVSALETRSDAACEYASRRLGIILKSYTVYFDIVVAGLDGVIVANGRPREYASGGTKHADAAWFKSAMATRTGEEFGFQGPHASSLAGGARVLIYSCKVGRGGEPDGETLGVLGVVFRWDALADQIVRSTPVDPGEKSRTRACIADAAGFILADSDGKALKDHLGLPDQPTLFARKKAYLECALHGRPALVAHALSPGFETYASGWHSVIVQYLE